MFLKPQLINETQHSASPGENVDDEKGFSFGTTKGIFDVWTVGWRHSSRITEVGDKAEKKHSHVCGI